MASSYSFRTCWVGKEDKIGYGPGMGRRGNRGSGNFVCGDNYIAGELASAFVLA